MRQIAADARIRDLERELDTLNAKNACKDVEIKALNDKLETSTKKATRLKSKYQNSQLASGDIFESLKKILTNYADQKKTLCTSKLHPSFGTSNSMRTSSGSGVAVSVGAAGCCAMGETDPCLGLSAISAFCRSAAPLATVVQRRAKESPMLQRSISVRAAKMAVDVETRELRRPGARSQVIYL